MRAAIYARFSSDQQNPRSCADQIAHVRPWIQARGWTVERTYQDDALSGREIVGRVGWRRLLEDSEGNPRPFDVVVVEDLDRWGREFWSYLDAAGRLSRAGVQLASPSGGIPDLTTTAGRIMLAVSAATSADVSQRISEHTKRGLAQRIGHVSKAGGRTPYGYRAVEHLTDRRDSRGRQVRERVTLEIDPESAAVVREIYRLRLDVGWGYRSIAKRLNQDGVPSPRARTGERPGGRWSEETVRGILVNPVYSGHTQRRRWVAERDPRTGKRIVHRRPKDQAELIRDTHPALIHPDVWERVQRSIRDVSPGLRRREALYTQPASGLLVCAACGSLMGITGRDRYACQARAVGACTNRRGVRRSWLEAQLRLWLTAGVGGAADAVERAILELPDRHLELGAACERAAAELVRARAAHRGVADAIAAHGYDAAMGEALLAARARVAHAEAALASAEVSRDSAPDPEAARTALAARAVEEWMRPLALRELVRRLVAHPDGTVEIRATAGDWVTWLDSAPRVTWTLDAESAGQCVPNGMPGLDDILLGVLVPPR